MIRSEHSWARRLATAGMVGVASLSAAACPAPPPPTTAHVVILDEFPQSGRAEDVSHGTLVEAVLRSRSRGDLQVERQQVSLGASMDEISKGEPGGLERYVVQRFSVPTVQTAQALDRIHGPAVASQSQGASESRVVDALWGAAQNPGTRAFLETELGVAPGTPDGEFLQALVDRVDELHGADPSIRGARQELRRSANQAADEGVIRVLSAGNNGELDRKLEQFGVTVSRDFYLNDLADARAIIVGAADHRGTTDPADDGAAALASPNAGATVAAFGVQVPIHVNGKLEYHDGSSYAQPQVASVVAEWLVQDPKLTSDQATQRLLEQARPVPGAESQLGYGIIGGGWQFSN